MGPAKGRTARHRQAIHRVLPRRNHRRRCPEFRCTAGLFRIRIRIPGRGLKDLILNHPYIFEVAEPDDIELPQQHARQLRESRRD